jgi:hypothetical protein
MPAVAEGNHGGDVGLAAQAAATRGSRPYGLSPPLRRDRDLLGLSLHTNQLWVVITTLSCGAGTDKSAPVGGFLTETRDAGSFVGRLRSLLLQSADNASAALIPGQTVRQRVLKVRPAEADQDPEAVDGCLVCSCCSLDYASISRRDLWSIALLNHSMIFSLVL